MELEILKTIYSWHTPVLDPIMVFITRLADKGWFWLALAVLLMIPKKTRVWGCTMIFAIGIGTVISSGIIKPLVNRTRPYEVAGLTKELLVAPLDDGSFPSGHTMASFAGAFVLLVMDKRAGIPAMILAVLIGFSRLYVFVHYPTDVAVGLLLGLICGFIACRFFQPWLSHCFLKLRRRRESR